MKTNLKRYLALFCAMALTIGCLPLGALAANHKTMDVEINQQGIYDVSLSVPGESDKLGVDIIYAMSGSSSWDDGMLPALIDAVSAAVANGTTVNLGLVPFSYDADVVMELTPIKTMEDVNNLPTMIDEAWAAFNNAGYAQNGNLEHALIHAKKMLSASELSDHPERQHLVLISTGHVYEFNDGENNEYAACAPVYVTDKNEMYYSGSHWSRLRNAGSSQYRIPDAIVRKYNANKDQYESQWDCYWSYIEKWVAADKIEEANGKPHVFRYGLTSDRDSFVSLSSLTADEMKQYPNMKYNVALGDNELDTAHAIIYERAMYETYEYAKANIIDAGINFYPVYVGMYSNGKSDNGYAGKNYVGHSFMNMLAGGKAAQYSYTEDNGAFFAPIKEKILYSCSADSTVENFLGYVEGENGYNFDFEIDGTIALTVGGQVYSAAKLENPAEGATASYAFTAPEATEPTFWLDYYEGNGNDTEKFIMTFGETVSLERPLTLDYQVKLRNAADTAALRTADDRLYISNSATLYPVNSAAKAGDPEQFNVPYVINWAATEIEIDNAKDFIEFVDVTNGKHPFFAVTEDEVTTNVAHSFEGQTIKLTKDIDLGDYWWYYYDIDDPDTGKIDRRIEGFRGILDGQNHTISNMKYHAPEGSSKPSEAFLSLGMFRNLYGTVKNFTINNVGGFWNDDHTELLPAVTGPSTRFFALAYRTRGALIENITAQNINVEMMKPGAINEAIIASDLYTSFNGLLGVVTWEDQGTCGNGMYTKVVNCHVKNANAVVYGNSQYASGGFAYKASEMSVFEGCTVDGLQLVITGDSDNFGGFIGEIGLASTATACSVNNVNVVVNGQSRAGMGGFMGDTVGGTGWGDSVHITDCTVSNTDITVNTVNSPIGGFVGDLIGGRSAFFEDNTVADSVCITGTNIGDGKATGTPGVGGFLGGLFGRSNLAANNEHSFTSCTTSAVINAGAAPAGGFVGSAVMGNGNQMRVIFEDCAFDGKVVTTNTAVAFVGTGDIGTKGTDKNYDEYINCTVSGATIIGTAPEAQQITLGGAFSYEMEAGNGYSTLETTINQDTTYSTYKQPVAEEPAQPAMVMFRMRRNVMPAATNDLVKVEFYLNAEATEPLHSFERYLNTALDGTNYPALDESPEYALTEAQLTKIFGFMAHEDGLAQVTWLMEDGTEFTPSTLVTDNIKVYASFSSASTNATLEGEVSMDDVLADGYEFVLMQGEDVLQTVSPVNGKFTFATIDFSKEGTYTFTVAQVIGNNETTVYDKSVYTVTITVSLVDGEIVTNVEFKLNDASVEKIAFSNKTINSVKVNLNGNSYMDDDFSDDFEFALEENGETKQTMFSIFGEFSTRLTFNKVGTYTFNIRQVVGDDETTVYDESVYTVIVNVTREGDTLVATTQLLLDGEAVDEISFSNETKVPETPTKPPKDGDGIYNVMFVMLVSMALLGSCVALKRKEN